MDTLKSNFERVLSEIDEKFILQGQIVEAPNWQSSKAPAPMYEITYVSFNLGLGPWAEDDIILAEAIRPNLPWADQHFEEERMSGEPINPGETWKIWPWSGSAAKHLKDGENVPKYDHSYAERYWPKTLLPNGCRFPTGDLEDMIDMLAADPLTRQAYLPIFFPEDTWAAKNDKRVPCTLGYHFLCRGNTLSVIYPMRSCDYNRHFRDDVYLTIRLLTAVLDGCRKRNPDFWNSVEPGRLVMHISSLHVFAPERALIQNRYDARK